MKGRWRPSAGFVAVCVTYVFSAAFFVWGLSTPPLDRVWTLQHMLKTGKMERLSSGDRDLLEDAMRRHPTLAQAILNDRKVGILSASQRGWIETPTVTILRLAEGGGGRKVVLDVQSPKDLFPLSVLFRGSGWEKRIDFQAQEIREVTLPDPPAAAEIVEMIIEGKALAADRSVLGIRVQFPGGA